MAQIKLKRLTIVNGNPYHAGVYEENYLPDSIKNDPSLVEDLDDSVSTPDYQNTLKKQSINIGGDKPNAEQISFKGETPKVINDDKKRIISDEGVPSVVINTATVDQLVSLDGVTVSIAQKIVEEREKEKFSDYSDLDKRAGLKGNRKWESLSDRVTLSADESS